jgi:hypothetical protein
LNSGSLSYWQMEDIPEEGAEEGTRFVKVKVGMIHVHIF